MSRATLIRTLSLLLLCTPLACSGGGGGGGNGDNNGGNNGDNNGGNNGNNGNGDNNGNGNGGTPNPTPNMTPPPTANNGGNGGEVCGQVAEVQAQLDAVLQGAKSGCTTDADCRIVERAEVCECRSALLDASQWSWMKDQVSWIDTVTGPGNQCGIDCRPTDCESGSLFEAGCQNNNCIQRRLDCDAVGQRTIDEFETAARTRRVCLQDSDCTVVRLFPDDDDDAPQGCALGCPTAWSNAELDALESFRETAAIKEMEWLAAREAGECDSTCPECPGLAEVHGECGEDGFCFLADGPPPVCDFRSCERHGADGTACPDMQVCDMLRDVCAPTCQDAACCDPVQCPGSSECVPGLGICGDPAGAGCFDLGDGWWSGRDVPAELRDAVETPTEVTFEIRNVTNVPIFVAQGGRSDVAYGLELDRCDLRSDLSIPENNFCACSCPAEGPATCPACAPPLPVAIRLPPSATITSTWAGTELATVERDCAPVPSAPCLKEHNALPGEYRVEVCSYPEVDGGEPDAEDPNRIVGGSVSGEATCLEVLFQYPLDAAQPIIVNFGGTE